MKSRKNGHYSVKNGLPITYYRAKRCKCFSGGCSSQQVIEALKRVAGTWQEPKTGNRTPIKRIKTSSSDGKLQTKPPFPGLAKYPEPRESTPGLGKDEKGNRVWNYDKIRRMVRIDKKTRRPNGKPEKIGYPQFRAQKGKGENDWGLYNIDSVLFPTPENKGKLLLMVEGEPCTDTAAKLGCIALTVQAAE